MDDDEGIEFSSLGRTCDGEGDGSGSTMSVWISMLDTSLGVGCGSGSVCVQNVFVVGESFVCAYDDNRIIDGSGSVCVPAHIVYAAVSYWVYASAYSLVSENVTFSILLARPATFYREEGQSL